jgi:hypothetical protein
MPGIPTEHLAEQIEQTNRRLVESNGRLADEIHTLAAETRESHHRLATELRESNQRLADAISGLARDFGNFRVEVAKELGAIRAETTKDLGEISAKLGSASTSLKFAGRGVAILIPVVISLIGAAIGIAWYAGRLDNRLEHVEKAVAATQKPATVKR